MAEEQTFNTAMGSTGKSPLLLIIAVIAVIGVGGLAGYLWSQKGALVERNRQLDQEIESVNAQILELENQNLASALMAQEWLKEIEEEEIKWSGVITRLNSTVPFDAVSKQEKAIFTSYSGGTDGRITLTTQTRPVSYNPFLDVAELIEVFNESTAFTEAYVPAISKTEDEDGRELATFVLNLKYLKPDLSGVGETGVGGLDEEAVGEEEVKVSR